MKRTGLYFGTFNPIHIGHLAIANHMVEFSELEEVWFVITPVSPFKKKSSLLDNHHRLEMVYMATEGYAKLKPSDIEFKMEPPYYTVNTLVYLEEKYPDHKFSLIMGEDNIKGFHKWKNHEVILEKNDLFVYPRLSVGETVPAFKEHPKIHFVDAPIMEISASFIRKSIAEGKNIKPLLPEKVWDYIDRMNFYK
ncbi:nicotinate-nucleotide adenylyltransferase [Zhouia spongiae]|uniref:Probable nicotinate-nucleotide adenylyltransferase n=1 Tax=Zhouia spongiae TaxID=2202721 RepID=A0ABY3YNT8_9FLAO|nr:nicotinate (nicotinamide) nucleotide adenylyltransferase [Zhouia spongiae]UNY99485.1 nicotinate-nucleotide adenylyltransferase [Zhouia spongiae]